MTTAAIIADTGEGKAGSIGMALRTTYRLVYPREWKSILLVQIGDVVDQPVGCAVAARTVGSDRELVHILVTSVAI